MPRLTVSLLIGLVCSDNHNFILNPEKLVLSNRFEVLSTDSDVKSDSDSIPLQSNHLLTKQDLQRSTCLDDRKFSLVGIKVLKKLACKNISCNNKCVQENTKNWEWQNLDNDTVLVPLDTMDPAFSLDTLDSVRIQGMMGLRKTLIWAQIFNCIILL